MTGRLRPPSEYDSTVASCSDSPSVHRQLPLPQRRRCTTTDPRIIRGKPPTSEPAITHILSSARAARAARADEASQGLSERGWRWLGVSPEKPGNDLRQLTRECETPLRVSRFAGGLGFSQSNSVGS